MDIRAIQAHLRAGHGGQVERIGPFLLSIALDTTVPGRNYAIPDDDAAPTDADVAALLDRFAAYGRLPRFEYTRPAPAVDRALTTAGFTMDTAHTLLGLAAA